MKEDAIAGGVPVTYALIKASDHIEDAFFPETVQAENYVSSLTVQEIFTGNDSVQGIAARNMVSVNVRKSHLIPCLLDLIREAGMLPGFACDHRNTENVPEVKSTCKEKGHAAGTKCADCGAILSGCEEYKLAEHSYTVKLNTVAPSCTDKGYTVYRCVTCSLTEYRDPVDALGHDYVDGACSRCGATEPDNGGENNGRGNFFSGFLTRIRDFFQKISDFFRDLFNR